MQIFEGSVRLTLVSTTAATEEDTVCVLTCTVVVARWMSAPAWTNRSTTSVWPFLRAAYAGLTPSCIKVKNDMGSRYLCYTNMSSNHTHFI